MKMVHVRVSSKTAIPLRHDERLLRDTKINTDSHMAFRWPAVSDV